MITKKAQLLMDEIDKNGKFPKHWRKFINKQTIEHNLIIKRGKEHYCTCCKKYFYKDTQIANSYYGKWNYKHECPHCKNKFILRNHNLKNMAFYKDVCFYTKVNNEIIIRGFEIKSTYDYINRKFIPHVQEYFRLVPSMGVLINNSLSFYLWNYKITHYSKKKKPVWRIYTGIRRFYVPDCYRSNLKQLLKNTPYKYIDIDLVKKRYPYYDDFQILQLITPPAFEILWKMQLYGLVNRASSFRKKGSFQKIFGVPKNFYSFMKEHNISYNQLQILKILQKPDYSLLQQYQYYNSSYLRLMKNQGFLYDKKIIEKYRKIDLKDLKFILKYTTIRRLEKRDYSLFLYKDYLFMAEQLGIDLRKSSNLFPENLRDSHDALAKQYKVEMDCLSKLNIYKRFYQLSNNIYEDFKYIIFPAPSLEDFNEEAKQQGNCILSYVHRYRTGKTEIYFMREKKNISKSLVTVEYKAGKIAQAEQKSDGSRNKGQLDPTAEQKLFLNKWVAFRKKRNNLTYKPNSNKKCIVA